MSTWKKYGMTMSCRQSTEGDDFDLHLEINDIKVRLLINKPLIVVLASVRAFGWDDEVRLANTEERALAKTMADSDAVHVDESARTHVNSDGSLTVSAFVVIPRRDVVRAGLIKIAPANVNDTTNRITDDIIGSGMVISSDEHRKKIKDIVMDALIRGAAK